ncbi:Hemolysin-type calcium-binding repeat (2 copies), partial [Snodgrassella alvi SCGC AB-598-J21]
MIQSLENKDDVLTIVGWDYMGGGKLGIRLPKFKDSNNNKINKIIGDWRTKIIHKEGYFELDESLAGQYYWGWKNRNAKGAIIGGVVEKGFEDVIKGTDGADEINGLDGGDAIDGMGGNDIILGGDGTDLLAGGGGSDIIKGGAGDDFIWANNHLNMRDRIRPGERWTMPASGKKMIYAGPNWGIYIDQQDTMIFDGLSKTFDDAADVGGDFLYGGDGSDYIVGSNLNDYIEGDSVAPASTEQGDDIIYGMAGNDYIIGGKGNDFLHGDGILRLGFLNSLAGALHGDDYIDGGDGDDQIIGDGGNDVIIGGNGNDKLYGDNAVYTKEEMLDAKYHGNDTIYGGAGNDEIIGGGG